jgi:hypothetical protein
MFFRRELFNHPFLCHAMPLATGIIKIGSTFDLALLGPRPFLIPIMPNQLEHYPTHAHLLHLLPTLKINFKKNALTISQAFHNKANGVVRTRVFLKFKKILVSSMMQNFFIIWRWGCIFKS